jgi:DNA segregation ATPase FtsK/SpoIIIE, S-DNA-T family
VNHSDDHDKNGDNSRDLFERWEAEMAPNASDGAVFDLGKARSARTGTTESPDVSGDSDERAVMVDRADASGPGALERIRDAKRMPVRPDWMRSKSGFVNGAMWVAGYAGHTIAFHALRSPVYTGRLMLRTPRGLARTLSGLGRWARDAESGPLRAAEAQRENTGEWLKVSRQRDRRVRWRGTCVLLGAPFVLALLVYLALFAPALVQAAATTGAVVVFGLIGAPADAPLSTRAVVKSEVAKLTGDIVVKAMASIGISQITNAVAKGGEGIEFVSPITREGPGWRADINLPLGVTPGDVVGKRSRLASGLRRPLGCVWPEGDPGAHEGRLILWVGDKDLSQTGNVKWQLASGKSHNVFKRIPFGMDPRGRSQSVPLIQHNVLVGSLPGQGKTASIRVLACGAALDPSVELWLHENKGTGDLDELAKCSHRFVSGIDDDSIAYAAKSLKLLRAEVMRRAAAIKKLPRDLCPDKRITRQIADKRSLKLWPLVAVFDECQNLFAHSTYGKQAGDDAEFIIKLGRALGVTLILATQRPDKDSLPTGISGNVSIRFCLKVAGQTENDMILGTSAYKNGVRATIFRPGIPEEGGDAGIGYLAGATATPTVVRTAYLDDHATAKAADHAHALRKAAGTLSGHALGEDDDAAAGPSYDLLADIHAIVPESEERVWNERIAARLAELRPEVYGGWKGENVTAALKPHGVKTRDVAGNTDDGTRTTRRGIVRDDITTAKAERDENRGAA